MTWKWQGHAGAWNAYLTEAATRGDAAEVRRRLDRVPASMRDQVRRHARTVWKLTHGSSGSGEPDGKSRRNDEDTT